ncbi:helix-turn-helix domain-containing protein [Priestia flexa]|uniref:helix-turn-helix domain-containing protein n=1 Tax=Priestia flexa TaxID=86664 RepID=UPI00240D3BEE|nr:helix-turn-helix domain-containing protein [Priestia flexa]WEZ08671.1 helix-turn-helix domain-containing protein [Priestia flexa]
MKNKADILLHPVRMRIVQALLEEKLTVYQLVKKLGNVPQATMYRQLSTLVDAGLVLVSEERLVRGTPEKIYSVVDEHLRLSPQDIAAYSQEEHLRFFMVYNAHLLMEMQQYLLSRYVENYIEDGFRYGITPLHLSKEEKIEFFDRYRALIGEFVSKKPSPDRKLIKLATTFIPTGD